MIEKYHRELLLILRFVDAISDEASQDMSINEEKRDELYWELYHLKLAIAECLVSIRNIVQEPGRP